MNKSRLIYSHRADSHVHVCTCTYNILNMNIYTCIRTCNILKMPLLIYKREEGFIFISETLRISMFACQCYYVIIMISYLSNLPNVLFSFLIFSNFFFTACLSVSVKKVELYFHSVSIITTMAKFHFGNSFQ